jgi:hypothetical protein
MFTSFNDSDLDGLAIQQIAVVHPTVNELHPSSRGYAANNVYPGFPPLMNDGRALIASWQPEAVENNRILKSSGVTSNWEYRKYLTHNAESIVQHNFSEAANDCGYYDLGVKRGPDSSYLPIFAGLPKSHSSPAQYNSYIQSEHEFGKFNSDLKANYLSREQLAARTVTPVITQYELLKLQNKSYVN